VTSIIVDGRTVTIERAGWLYRYTVHRNGVVMRYGCAFTMWGVRHAARRT
jgi:hypothetical protein